MLFLWRLASSRRSIGAFVRWSHSPGCHGDSRENLSPATSLEDGEAVERESCDAGELHVPAAAAAAAAAASRARDSARNE
jgi:hypothetical protein